MGYRRGRGHYWEWDGYEPTVPKQLKDGIKAKSERGSIGETWWSKRWVGVLESFSMGTRLTRGRSYARRGQVISIEVEAGIVKAKVQGSQPKPYNVKIKLQPLAEQDWDKVTNAMASQAIFAARLLAGEMPKNIEEAFQAVNVALFPTAITDLTTACSCPDWANPCKHVAAVYYLLAERFDEDPFLIFKLRGRTKEQIIEALHNKRAETLVVEGDSHAADEGGSPEAASALPLLAENLDAFWQAQEALATFTVQPGAPEVDKAILKRLGDAPFAIGNQNITTLLAKAYDAVKVVLQEEADEDDGGQLDGHENGSVQ
jgi:uncharacterized Zn finger protein